MQTKKSQKEVRKTQTLKIQIYLPPAHATSKRKKDRITTKNIYNKNRKEGKKTQTLNIPISLAFRLRAVKKKTKTKKSTNT